MLEAKFQFLKSEGVKGQSLPGGWGCLRIDLWKSDFIYEIKTKDLQQFCRYMESFKRTL